MKKILEYEHGASYWVRVRIPKNLKWAYPDGQDEILDNLHTGAPSEAKFLWQNGRRLLLP